jgi:hypothetical protein
MKDCVYSEKMKKIFGPIGEGIHSYRVFNIAIIDVIGTIIGAYLLHRFLLPTIPFYQVLFGLFLLGIVLHRIFCVRTTVDKWIFE